jgi:hypothetical protein
MRIARAVCKTSAQRRYSVINVPAASDFRGSGCIAMSSIRLEIRADDALGAFIAQFRATRVRSLARTELPNRHAHTVCSETSVNVYPEVG